MGGVTRQAMLCSVTDLIVAMIGLLTFRCCTVRLDSAIADTVSTWTAPSRSWRGTCGKSLVGSSSHRTCCSSGSTNDGRVQVALDVRCRCGFGLARPCSRRHAHRRCP